MKSEIIYRSTREHLMNNLLQLQMLQDEGIRIGKLPDEVWDQIVDLIEREDEQKLAELRKELRSM